MTGDEQAGRERLAGRLAGYAAANECLNRAENRGGDCPTARPHEPGRWCITCAVKEAAAVLRTLAPAPSEGEADAYLIEVQTKASDKWHPDHAIREYPAITPPHRYQQIDGAPVVRWRAVPLYRHPADPEPGEGEREASVQVVRAKRDNGFGYNWRVEVRLPGVEEHALSTARYRQESAERIAERLRACLASHRPPEREKKRESLYLDDLLQELNEFIETWQLTPGLLRGIADTFDNPNLTRKGYVVNLEDKINIRVTPGYILRRIADAMEE